MEGWAVLACDWARLLAGLLLPRGGIAPAPRRRSLTWDRGLKNQKFLSSERRPTLVTGLP